MGVRAWEQEAEKLLIQDMYRWSDCGRFGQ